MKPPRPRNVDTKGTLARVERNVRIARHAGWRLQLLVGGSEPVEPPGSPEWLALLSPEEREARNELSPVGWANSFHIGWRGVTGE